MTTSADESAAFRQALLTSPGERQGVEYKSAIPFNDNTDFGLKLIKHILGMANTGGGRIVIGYDDDNLQPDPKHSEGIATTYDTTLLSQAVNSSIHRGQSIKLSVFKETHPETQLTHPEIQSRRDSSEYPTYVGQTNLHLIQMYKSCKQTRYMSDDRGRRPLKYGQYRTGTVYSNYVLRNEGMNSCRSFLTCSVV